ncbi:hypothetical protein, partial [Bradyrhizobium canariense]|uniref:hypothetical protein n=1 Tax=Bradyrhizobium canariense TaxID=255045 RepID=UPI001AEC78B0
IISERCFDMKVSRKARADKAWTPEQYFHPSRTIVQGRRCVIRFDRCFCGRFRPTCAGRLCDNRRDRDACNHVFANAIRQSYQTRELKHVQ